MGARGWPKPAIFTELSHFCHQPDAKKRHSYHATRAQRPPINAQMMEIKMTDYTQLAQIVPGQGNAGGMQRSLLEQAQNFTNIYAQDRIYTHGTDKDLEPLIEETLNSPLVNNRSLAAQGLKRRIPEAIYGFRLAGVEAMREEMKKYGFTGSFGDGSQWTADDYITLRNTDPGSYNLLMKLPETIQAKEATEQQKADARAALSHLAIGRSWQFMYNKIVTVSKELRTRGIISENNVTSDVEANELALVFDPSMVTQQVKLQGVHIGESHDVISPSILSAAEMLSRTNDKSLRAA